ncbi:MAG TPA: nitrate- and nitrite sensing domain-containing protein, partial [Acidimicrobiales bacterium]|nr:nitrate- and nitrite sensing domain-containing protein [Acidimicrobiales bacterium]
MRRIPIRTKLAAALLVPLVVLFTLTAVEVLRLVDEVGEVRAQAELAEAAIGPGGLINTLQDERSWAAVDLVGRQDSSAGILPAARGYDETRAATDEAVAALRDEIEHLAGPVADAYEGPLDALAALDQVRTDIDTNRASSPAMGTNENEGFSQSIFVRYTDLIQPLFAAADDVTATIEDPELRQGTDLVNRIGQNIDLFSVMARHNILLVTGGPAGDVPAGAWDETAQRDAAVARKVFWDQNDRIIRRAPPPYDTVVEAGVPDEFVTNFTDLSQRVIDGDEVAIDELVQPLTVADYGGLRPLRIAMSDEVDDVAAATIDDAVRTERFFLALAGVTLIAALLLTWLVSRSITGPLQALTRQAKVMAEVRLPAAVLEVLETPLGEDVQVPPVEPVRVVTRDEVDEVADALNSVQDTALDLAVEQAVLRRNIADSFVNMGRRNQHLLVRQLDFITRLETCETDPDALANLYLLDHLATRMRRNAESLLVLAGIEQPRQWVQPLPLADVVRSARGEVEDFQRVVVHPLAPATILGSAAADIAHLLAELVENALTFSPPDRPVDVHGGPLADGRYRLAVIDRGVGMDDEARATANRRLAGGESFTVAPSKYLGHYVAGNLAARHGIAVFLVPTEGTQGTTATIDLPPPLITTRDRAPAAPGPAWPDQRRTGPVAVTAPEGAPPFAPAAPAAPQVQPPVAARAAATVPPAPRLTGVAPADRPGPVEGRPAP